MVRNTAIFKTHYFIVQINTMPAKSSTTPTSPVTKSATPAKKKKKLTKADIGDPSHFVHVNHVGYDLNSGIDDVSTKYNSLTEMDLRKNDIEILSIWFCCAHSQC